MINLITLLAAATIGGTTPAADDCDRRLTRGTSTSIHDSDDDIAVVTYVHTTGDRCESARLIGRLTYTPEEDDILAIPFGGSAYFRERTGSGDRAISFSRGGDGQVVRAFQRDGRNAEYDADARRWVAAFLPRVLIRAGVNVEPRVARWRARGGVDNVLRNIESIESSGSMRKHYDALLDGGRLTDDETERTLRSVGDNMRQSSGDLRHVLSRLAPAANLGPRTISALERAFANIPSSGDKAAVLKHYGQTGDPAMLAVVMRAAETVPSSGDKSRVLQQLAPRYLGAAEGSLRDAWFRTAETIPSSGDLRNTLMTAMPYAQDTPGTARRIISVARNIPSSGDRSSVLIALARTGALSERDTRAAFISAASDIPSDGDKARVLQALAALRD